MKHEDEDDFEYISIELDLENDEFLEFVIIEMAKKGMAVDREGIRTFMEIVDDYIIKKIEGEGFDKGIR
jgi:hypothetical protein